PLYYPLSAVLPSFGPSPRHLPSQPLRPPRSFVDPAPHLLLSDTEQGLGASAQPGQKRERLRQVRLSPGERLAVLLRQVGPLELRPGAHAEVDAFAQSGEGFEREAAGGEDGGHADLALGLLEQLAGAGETAGALGV